jgi:hypothetical protein
LEALLGTAFTGSLITSFDEFRFFTGIKSLPANSFRNWTELKSITLPESIESIDLDFNATTDNSIFRNCPKLETFKGKFASSDGKALIYNKRLVKVVETATSYNVPSTVDSIVRYAFFNSQMEKVRFTSSLKVIGESAFEFSKIDTVYFPMTNQNESVGEMYVTTIFDNSFAHCYKLKAFRGPKVKGSIRILSDYRLLVNDTTAIAYTMGSSEKQVVVPDSQSIKRLSDNLFDAIDIDGNKFDPSVYKNQLTTIALPTTINNIGAHSMRNAEELINLYFHGGVAPVYCGPEAFLNNNKMYVFIPISADAGAFSTVLNVDSNKLSTWITWPY